MAARSSRPALWNSDRLLSDLSSVLLMMERRSMSVVGGVGVLEALEISAMRD